MYCNERKDTLHLPLDLPDGSQQLTRVAVAVSNSPLAFALNDLSIKFYLPN